MFDELYAKQLELDIYMINGTDSKNLEEKTQLALLVEIGELANETKCFKYWSDSNITSKSKILDEYADVLHFYLSIGNTKNWYYNPRTRVTGGKDKIFMNLYSPAIGGKDKTFISLYSTATMITQYKTMYTDFGDYLMHLGELLNLTWEEIILAYYKKHAINYQRLLDKLIARNKHEEAVAMGFLEG